MIHLPTITLMAIDTANPGRSLLAIKHSLRFIRFARVVLLTNTNRFPAQHLEPRLPEVEIFHTDQSDRKASPFPGHPPIAVDYDRDVMCKTIDYCDTAYLMRLEYDSAILNPWAWDGSWLAYDFIAAPWPNHTEPGWPACDESNNVGNFGFCMGSKAFWASCREAYRFAEGRPDLEAQRMSSDRYICRTMRPWMEQQGTQFAPDHAAARFSCENAIYSGQFAYHGRTTALMNGWSPNFFPR